MCLFTYLLQTTVRLRRDYIMTLLTINALHQVGCSLQLSSVDKDVFADARRSLPAELFLLTMEAALWDGTRVPGPVRHTVNIDHII